MYVQEDCSIFYSHLKNCSKTPEAKQTRQKVQEFVVPPGVQTNVFIVRTPSINAQCQSMPIKILALIPMLIEFNDGHWSELIGTDRGSLIFSGLTLDRLFIGINDKVDEGVWKWRGVGVTVNRGVDYDNFEGPPADSLKDCGRISRSTGLWTWSACNNVNVKSNAVCEIDPAP